MAPPQQGASTVSRVVETSTIRTQSTNVVRAGVKQHGYRRSSVCTGSRCTHARAQLEAAGSCEVKRWAGGRRRVQVQEWHAKVESASMKTRWRAC